MIQRDDWYHSVQSLSHVQFFETPWTAARQASLSITNSQSLLKLMFIESVMPSNHLSFCHPLLLPPSIFLSQFKWVFSNESVLHLRWPNYWSFNFSIRLPMNIQDWFPLDWLVWSPCNPRDSQKSSPTPQFKSINHIHTWLLENHRFDLMDLSWQSNVFAF